MQHADRPRSDHSIFHMPPLPTCKMGMTVAASQQVMALGDNMHGHPVQCWHIVDACHSNCHSSWGLVLGQHKGRRMALMAPWLPKKHQDVPGRCGYCVLVWW